MATARPLVSPPQCLGLAGGRETTAMMDGNVAAHFAERQKGALPGELGIEWDEVATGRAAGWFTVTPRHMAPNGFLHAASVIALADSACGYACVASLPEGAAGFTTIEIKTNFLWTAKVSETVAATARLVHGGRMTQVWDAEVVNRTTGKPMALFRCTQMVLWPK
jgi:1,4-dihydroxy-2-naphthoyl-CoA hydrolase